MSNLQSSIPSVRKSGAGKGASIYKKNFAGFGWLKTLYELAEAQIFNQPNKTPIDSVLYTNTGEVFQYLSYIAAKSNYESEINEMN